MVNKMHGKKKYLLLGILLLLFLSGIVVTKIYIQTIKLSAAEKEFYYKKSVEYAFHVIGMTLKEPFHREAARFREGYDSFLTVSRFGNEISVKDTIEYRDQKKGILYFRFVATLSKDGSVKKCQITSSHGSEN
ncbi:hypothetical protein [Thermotalea metallivorans]|uniref:Uncharacterized protein n=1 Tax=Thermotalea metallivorans TaxID=520762 RepID=A0A140LAI7_9FIRM|nr:hypothetical protein [Thermotalea metallivorans]KXG77562.1 hypothetical protein AN619_04150 [Thermotalea metallivorans]